MPALAEQNFYDTPIFIINFNQLGFVRKQIAWLLGSGYRNVTVLDNHSTYPPLLRYYAEMTSSRTIAVVRRPRNDTKITVWNEHLRALDRPFVLTSSDVVPEAGCPADVVGHLARHLRDNPQIVKAGLGLRIDDLPARYRHRREVLIKQSEYWRVPAACGLFLAPIDTTFALYRGGGPFVHEPAVRTSWPYLARHEPWYSDSANPSEDERYYAATLPPGPGRGSWGRERLPEELLAACATLAAAPPRTRVHLACGRDVFPGWINVDVKPDVGADVVFDLERCADERLPIDDDSVDGFFMGHAFASIEGTLAMLQELYRVARPAARLVIRVRPHASGAGDGTGRQATDEFNRYGQPQRGSVDDGYAADWQLTRVKLVVDPALTEPATGGDGIDPAGADGTAVREIIAELRAVKPTRPRDPWWRADPAVVVTSSPIDTDSAF